MKYPELHFLKAFFNNWREVGSIIPSSRFLAGKMIETIDFDSADTLVELGPGLGSITKRLLFKMKPQSRLILFETNVDFCKELEKMTDKRLTVLNVSALEMSKLMGNLKADYVISGIPLACLKKSDKEILVREIIKILKEETGSYIQFQYSLESYKLLKSLFGKVNLGFTFWNTPPAFVYRCALVGRKVSVKSV